MTFHERPQGFQLWMPEEVEGKIKEVFAKRVLFRIVPKTALPFDVVIEVSDDVFPFTGNHPPNEKDSLIWYTHCGLIGQHIIFYMTLIAEHTTNERKDFTFIICPDEKDENMKNLVRRMERVEKMHFALFGKYRLDSLLKRPTWEEDTNYDLRRHFAEAIIYVSVVRLQRFTKLITPPEYEIITKYCPTCEKRDATRHCCY